MVGPARMLQPAQTPMAGALAFTQGDDRWLAYRHRFTTDLFWGASVVLGYANLFPCEPETHLLPTRFLERRTGIPDLDLAPIQLGLWPRETGKSSIGTVASAVQEACADPNTAILLANEVADNAEDFLKAIKYQFETNELLRALFPEVIPKDGETEWSATRASLKRTTGRPEPTFDAIGVGGTKTGKHYNRIIGDDLISRKVAESIRLGSKAALGEVNFWIKTLNPMLSQSALPFPWIRFLGTRWWLGDSYDLILEMFGHGEEARTYRLKATLPTGAVVSRDASRVGDLAVMKISAIEDGRATFPKIHPMDRLIALRQEDPELFACNMLNDPSNAAVRTFQDAWLHYWHWIDPRTISYRDDQAQPHTVFLDNLHTLMVVDPAFTAQGRGSRAATIVTGTDYATGKHLVLHATAQRLEPRDLVADLLHVAKRLKVPRIFIESVAQQMAFIQFVQREAVAQGLPVSIETVRPGGRAKDIRIECLAAYYKAGMLYLNADQHDLLTEYRSFKPGAIYKDLLDALAYASEQWPQGVGTGGFDRRQFSQRQLDAYRARRGMRHA